MGQHGMFGAISDTQERERRFYPRASVLAEQHQMIFVELGSTGGLLLDISAGGISVQAAHAIEKGLRLGLKFLLPFNRYLVQATCEVAWSDGGHAGLKFAPLSEVAQHQLGLWLEAYGKAIAPRTIPVEAPPPDVLQEITKYDESGVPISAASTSDTVEPLVASRIEPEPASLRQKVIERDQPEYDRVVDEVRPLTGADGAAIALRDDQDVVCETSPTVEPPRANRRASRRWLIAVSMLAHWRDGREHEVKVVSRDVSDGGSFFHSNSDIAIGTEVEVTFALPSDPGTTGNRRLRVQGTITRAERETYKTGYALRVTSSELLGIEDAVAQTRQTVRRLAARNASSGGSSRARRARLLFLSCSGLVGLILGILIARYEGDPEKATAAVLEKVASILSTQENAPPPDVLQSRLERKRKVLRTGGGVGATEKKAASGPAEHDAAERNASAAQVRSLTVDSTVQPRPVPFNNNNVLTLDVQEGKPVSPLGYIGELPSPPAQPVPAGSLARTPAKTEAAR